MYLRELSAEGAVALANTEDAQYPFWSPDGQWVGFYVRNTGLMKIMIGGGPPQVVCAAGNGKGGSWNESGQILFTTDYNSSIQVVDVAGGEPRPVTSLTADKGFNSHRHPQFLPDGRRFLYFARSDGTGESEVRLASLDDSTHQVIMNQSIMVEYASGNLLYINQETLVAQPFAADTGVLSGTPVRVASGVMVIPGAAKAAFSASGEGTLVYLRGFTTRDESLVWLDRDGRNLGQVSDQALYDMVTLSPDNSRAAVGIVDTKAGTWDIWIVDIERDFRTRFTDTASDEYGLVWHPDGRSLYFASDRDGQSGIYRKGIGAATDGELVFSHDSSISLWDCSIDGGTILYSVVGKSSKEDLWSAELSGESPPRLLRQTAGDDVLGKFSPDGKWVTFASAVGGQAQIFVAPWPEMSPLTQVSTTTGTWSFWSEDGHELIYQDLAGTVVAVSMLPENGEMRIGTPVNLFEFAAPVLEGPLLDVAIGGERFLTVDAVDSDPPAFCDVIMNWTALLNSR